MGLSDMGDDLPSSPWRAHIATKAADGLLLGPLRSFGLGPRRPKVDVAAF